MAKRGLRKLIVLVLNIILITILGFGFFILPKKVQAAASPQIINKQTQTLAAGESYIHSFIYAKGYIFAGTRTYPAKIMRFNNLDDLSDYTTTTFPNDGLHNPAESMVYDAGKDKIYIAFNYGGPGDKVVVTEFDPDDLTYTDVIADATEISGSSPGITTDGTSLYIITYRNPSKIIKYSLADFTKTSSLTINDGAENKSNGHSLQYDGTNLYATGISSPAWAAKIDPSDLSHTVANFQAGDNIATDDFAIVGDYLYVGLETTNGIIVRVKKSDLSLERIDTGQSVANYAVYYDNEYIWAAYASSPGTLVRINPSTLEVSSYTFDTGENVLNEIVSDGQKLFVTCWLNPAKVMSFNIDTVAPTTTVSLNPPVPDGDNGFYRSSPTITLSAIDTGAGVDKTYYQWNNNSYQEYSSSFFAPGGIHTLYYYSVDNIGNTETVKSSTIKTNTSSPIAITLIPPVVSTVPSDEVLEDISEEMGIPDSLTSIIRRLQPYIFPDNNISTLEEKQEKKEIDFSISVLDNLLENKQIILEEDRTIQFYTQTPLFSGKTIDNALIEITINSSKKIKDSTEANEEGFWHYQVQNPLEYGNHTIKIVINDPESDLFDERTYKFKIVPKVALESEVVENQKQSQIKWLWLLVPLGLLIIYFTYRKLSKKS